ncbi:hypothetical protein [Sutcliffiella rhizosphaerae]|uniref:DUF4625 domain-containing protein n=1 Tax=Sutcliffiella rhizosphaerae TaxID=2880967 RepID=A0ABN8A5U3_9BACI|nr:hypothetical protein [Sutcliffiella rhizosphaerae]CAG9620399.1 hypothetical protein BACCIP111883_01167 [Sutcliffiella rhizosphaerae]
MKKKVNILRVIIFCGSPRCLLLRFSFILMALFIGGCSNSNPVGNSLDLGQTYGMDCVPGGEGESRMFGDTFLKHKGDKEITIMDISLVNAEGMELTEAVLVKLEDDESLIGFGEWPPSDDQLPLPVNWDDRIEAVDAVIQPKEEWNLVFALTSTSTDTGSTDSVKIEYKDSAGKIFEQETLIQYIISPGPCE